MDIYNDLGTVHDFKMFKESLIGILPEDIIARLDSGYQGVCDYLPNAIIPYKASKKHPLTEEQKAFNKKHSQIRIAIERINRELKIFRICKETYRNKGNLFLVPVLAAGMMFVPFWYIRLTQSHYKKAIAGELETALSIITTAYFRNEDIQTAVEENLGYLNPPVLSVFRDFLARIRLVDPDVEAALRDMKSKISDMRIVNGELENLITEPRKEFIIMQILVVGNIPLMYFLNQDWYDTLMHTPVGQIILAVCAAVLFITTAFVIKLTQPIEYRR